MGNPNPPNYGCGPAPVVGELWEFTYEYCLEICTIGYFSDMDPWLGSCITGAGYCRWDIVATSCCIYMGFLSCMAIYSLTYDGCSERTDEASNQNDISSMIQFDYFGLDFDDILFDFYEMDEQYHVVISLRNRQRGINIKFKIDPGQFFD